MCFFHLRPPPLPPGLPNSISYLHPQSEMIKTECSRFLGGGGDGCGPFRSPTGRELKRGNPSQPRWICLGQGGGGGGGGDDSSVSAACSRGQRLLHLPPAVWAPGSRWVIGAVDSSTQQSLPAPAAHNDLLQGYRSHCHSDSK